MKALLLGVSLVLALAVPAPAGDLTLEFRDGYVTVSAHDVTLREILAEWARKGRTRIVNGEKVTGGLVTIELARVPEKQALEILLRPVSGYMVATRTTYVPNVSAYDRIMVMPTSTAPPPSAASARPAVPAPFGNPNPAMAMPMPMQGDDQDEPVSPPASGMPGSFGPQGTPNPLDPGYQAPNAPQGLLPMPGMVPSPMPDGQSPIRPYPNLADPNLTPDQQASPIADSPLKPGLITRPTPGALPATSKPPGQ